MQPVIQQLLSRKLIGMRVKTSRVTFQPYLLWSKFMPQKKRIGYRVNELLYSIQVYDRNVEVTLTTEFDQWAAVEVSNNETVPDGMETYDLEGGLYATFTYKGKAADFPQMIQEIHEIWLPQSVYEIDSREHFERLGAKYDPTSDESEEEVWIPIRLRKE